MSAEADVPSSLPLDEWVGRLAEPDGNPGGGSAAAVIVALSAALVHMVCAYTRAEPDAAAAGARAQILREHALEAARQDGTVSRDLGAALATGAGAERERRVREVAVRAAESSATLGRLALEVAEELHVVVDVGNPHLIADTTVAADALGAGVAAALTNLRANLALSERHGADGDDLDDLRELARRLEHEVGQVRSLADRIRP